VPVTPAIQTSEVGYNDVEAAKVATAAEVGAVQEK